MTGVAFDPVKTDIVTLKRFIEALPEIGVFDGLFISCSPAIPLPAMQP
jgi:hypothetical protein